MPKLKCFVIMPFEREFDPVFKVVAGSATDAVPGQVLDCVWLKQVQAAGKITDDIVEALRTADLCIADVSGCNPNVMWETGYAMALGKPTILIGRGVDELPFDLRVHRVCGYNPKAPGALAEPVAEAIRQTLARYEVTSQVRAGSIANWGSYVVAVTGTLDADEVRVGRRVETVLRPYVTLNPVWLCGSFGTVDEGALRFLVGNGQRAMAVGYHRYDLSQGVRDLLQEERIGFLDASVESVPRGLDGPTERDILFATKADLVVLFWDGKSMGTRKLIDYFRSIGRDTVVSYV